MSAALPLEPIQVKSAKYHTAVRLALSQSLCKLWPHVNIEMLGQIISHLSRFQTFINHGLDAIRVQSVEDITDPLLVNVNPISRIR